MGYRPLQPYLGLYGAHMTAGGAGCLPNLQLATLCMASFRHGSRTSYWGCALDDPVVTRGTRRPRVCALLGTAPGSGVRMALRASWLQAWGLCGVWGVEGLGGRLGPPNAAFGYLGIRADTHGREPEVEPGSQPCPPPPPPTSGCNPRHGCPGC